MVEHTSREDAALAGAKLYNTGRPCKRGHYDYRYVSGGACRACMREATQSRDQRSPDYNKARLANYYARNRAELLSKQKLYRDAHKDARRLYNKSYARNNLAKLRAKVAARKAKKLQATPLWADLPKIAAFYRACPKGYEVDHVIPLVSPFVCGLHVLENLQYLPRRENRSKGNLFMPGAV